MVEADDRITETAIQKAAPSTHYPIPFFLWLVQAGYPSSAETYVEHACDLNDLCITNPEATYFVRVASDSMIGDRIDRGDVLVVDCSRPVSEGKIVVAWLNGDHCVKRIHFAENLIVLMSSNPKYMPIYVQPGDDFKVFGVVTNVFFKPV